MGLFLWTLLGEIFTPERTPPRFGAPLHRAARIMVQTPSYPLPVSDFLILLGEISLWRGRQASDSCHAKACSGHLHSLNPEKDNAPTLHEPRGILCRKFEALLRGLLKMLESLFGMRCRCFGVLFLALGDGRFEMLDALFRVRVRFGFFGSLGVFQRSACMGDEHICMSRFPMGDGFLGVVDRLGEVILGHSRTRHESRGDAYRKKKND